MIRGIVPLHAEGLSLKEAESAFHTGNAMYQEGNFENAIDFYEEVIAAGFDSGPLYYNLGNAYYRTGDFARAILNYERALHRMPNDDDLKHNLEMARLMIVDQIESVPRIFLWDYWDSFRDSLPISTLTALAFAAFVVILAAISLVVLSRDFRTRRLGLFAGSAAVIVLAVALLFLVTKVSRLARDDYGIVIAEVVEVKNAPDTEGPSAFILHAGSKVRITDRVGEWIQVRLLDGKVGWMTETGVEII
jgi:tetratricopeptide (TPR) repeat protein